MSGRRISTIWIIALAAVLSLGAAGTAPSASADERHSGYYYPPLTTEPEVYEARARTMVEANRSVRIGFVTGIVKEQLTKPYPQTVAIFAKGTEAQKLIIVALEDGRIDTIYRARAVFATLTGSARLLPVFSELGVQESFTFFDLCKMLGFEQITITNGRDFSHQVILK